MSDTRNTFKLAMPQLKWGLVSMAVGLGLCIVMVAISNNMLGGAQRTNSAATKRLSDARKNLAAAQEDRENMAAYAAEYEVMLQRNLVGDEKRIDWIDGLEALRKLGLVLDFQYSISPQQPYTPAAAKDSGNFALNLSPMSLTLDLLHEGQLAHFFDTLRSNIRGQYMLNGCDIVRLDKDAGNTRTSGIAPILKAECKGGWLTFKNRSVP